MEFTESDMDFTETAKKIAEQLTLNYNWQQIPPNHSGSYWRDSLFIHVDSNSSFRFDILGLTVKQSFDRIGQVMAYYTFLLVPHIQQREILCKPLQRQLDHSYDKKIKQELEDAQNDLLLMNEPMAQIRAFREIWMSYISPVQPQSVQELLSAHTKSKQ